MNIKQTIVLAVFAAVLAIPMTMTTADASNKPSEPGCSNPNAQGEGVTNSRGICYDADNHLTPPYGSDNHPTHPSK